MPHADLVDAELTGTIVREYRGRILVVDDEPSIRASLTRLLRRDGYQIVAASNIDEALDRLDAEPVDLMIVDQRMPGQVGTELCAVAAEHYPNTIRIVLSGYSDLNEVARAISLGHVHHFLSKPWDDSALRSHIRKALDSRVYVSSDKMELDTACEGRLVTREWLEARLNQLSQLGEQFGPNTNTVALVVFSVRELGSIQQDENSNSFRQVEARFIRALTATDALAQICPGIYAALTVRPGGVNAADRLFGRLLRSLSDPIEIDGANCILTLSAGAAFSDGDAELIPSLLEQAIDAHRWGSAVRANQLLYFRRERATPETVSPMREELRTAVDRDQLSLYCMPEVSLRDGSLVGFESHVRWIHPRFGAVEPTLFNALREDIELSRMITLWTLRQSLATLAPAQSSVSQLKRLSLEIKAAELAGEHFTDLVSIAFSEAQLDPAILTIGLSATDLPKLNAAALNELGKLRGLGVHVAIERFGNTAIARDTLMRVPFDTVKVDPMRMRACGVSDKARRALHTTLARIRRASVIRIAQGIETLHELQAAIAIGCEMLQGFVYSRPIPAAQFAHFVRSSATQNLDLLQSNQRRLIGGVS